MTTSSMFNPGRKGGGGGGGTVTVVNNLTTDSASSALSASMGKKLAEMIDEHSKVKASETVLGHVKVDGTTIAISADGTISSVGGNTGGSGVVFKQAVLPTVSIGQNSWEIPFDDFVYPNDLLIVSHNTTLLSTDMYTITSDNSKWILNITDEIPNDLPIDRNHVFVIMIKGGGTSSPQVVQKTYHYKLETTTIGQNKWDIPIQSFDSINDSIMIVYNTTMLMDGMSSVVQNGSNLELTIHDIPNDQPISKNDVEVYIFKNTLSNGIDEISGSILINNTVPESKLEDNTINKINMRTIVFGTQGSIETGLQDSYGTLSFKCEVISVDATLLQPSDEDMEFNFKTTNDFTTWTDILPQNLLLDKNTNSKTFSVQNTTLDIKDIVRLDILSDNSDAKNLVINMNVKLI